MGEYRTTATLTAEGTFVVPGPKDLPVGTKAEVTVRVEQALVPTFDGPDPIREFYAWLESQPPRESTLEAERAMLREMRDDWDRD